MLFSLHSVAEGQQLYGSAAFPDLDAETVSALLTEAAKLAEEEIAPSLQVSDRSPPILQDRQVTSSPDMHATHALVSENGWIAMPYPKEVGGLGLPWSVSALMLELLDSANVAFALSACMTQGCAEAILAHGSQDQINTYVPHLLSGRCMGTMELTEASAGSDVGALKTKASDQGNGTWQLNGTKIYISWGDSDLAENIVHLVLARTPGSPAGTKGLSLFLVPKILPDGRRNSVFPSGLENKLGLHGSPTCTLIHEDSVGWMVGEECAGMAAMFTMMNNARIGVGFQGLGVSERAYQAALAHAQTRVQGGTEIINHPDVRRNLLFMKALTAVSRDLGYRAHVAGDLARLGGEAAAVHEAQAGLLTPLAKAFMTDAALEVSNLAIQVYGGLGVIEEGGVAQLARDCRVFSIYEGTNGIQALDLLGRKTLRDGGGAVFALLDEIQQTLAQALESNLRAFAQGLSHTNLEVRRAVETLIGQANDDPASVTGCATAYLRALALLVSGQGMLKRALAAQDMLHSNPGFATEQLDLANFFFGQILPRARTALAQLAHDYRSLRIA